MVCTHRGKRLLMYIALALSLFCFVVRSMQDINPTTGKVHLRGCIYPYMFHVCRAHITNIEQWPCTVQYAFDTCTPPGQYTFPM